jgi:hypothetical protein
VGSGDPAELADDQQALYPVLFGQRIVDISILRRLLSTERPLGDGRRLSLFLTTRCFPEVPDA